MAIALFYVVAVFVYPTRYLCQALYLEEAVSLSDRGSGLVETEDAEVIYMVSSIKDNNASTVVEAVLVVHDVSGVTLQELGVGWCPLSLLSPGRAAIDVSAATRNAQEPRPNDVQLHAGSPRALLTSPPGSSFPVQPQCALLYHFFHHGALRQMHTLVADDEIWGSYDTLPGLALCRIPTAALTLPAQRLSALARDGVGQEGAGLWIPCMGPPNPALLAVPVNPTTAVGISLTLSGLRVCLPPGFERKLLLVVTASREVELGLRSGSITSDKVRITQRVLTLALHNGHTAIQRTVVRLDETFVAQQPHGSTTLQHPPSQQHVPMQPGSLALPGSVLLGAEESKVVLHGYTPHELMALTLSLEYVVAEPTPVALQVIHRSAPPMPHTHLTAPSPPPPAAQHPPPIGGAGTPAAPPHAAPHAAAGGGNSAAEQMRHILVAQHVYIPVSPQPTSAQDGARDDSQPPRRLLVLANRASSSDPSLQHTFTRHPWEVPLLSPNPGLRLSHAVPLANAEELESVLSQPALHHGCGPLNIVVGAAITAAAETAPTRQELVVEPPPTAPLLALPPLDEREVTPRRLPLVDIQQPARPLQSANEPRPIEPQQMQARLEKAVAAASEVAEILAPQPTPVRPPSRSNSSRSPVPRSVVFEDELPLHRSGRERTPSRGPPEPEPPVRRFTPPTRYYPPARSDDDSPDSFVDSPGQQQLLPTMGGLLSPHVLQMPVTVMPAPPPPQPPQPPPLESLLSRVVALPLSVSQVPMQPPPQQQQRSGRAWDTSDPSAEASRRSGAAELSAALLQAAPLQPPPPPRLPGPFGSPLSRVDRDRLLRWGFTNVLRVRSDGGVLGPDDFWPRRSNNIALELSDSLPAYTVTLQMAAVTLFPAVTGLRRTSPHTSAAASRDGVQRDAAVDDDFQDGVDRGTFEVAHPRALYFTFQLYCAPPVRTFPALLLPDAATAAAAALSGFDSAGADAVAHPSQEPQTTFILAREDSPHAGAAVAAAAATAAGAPPSVGHSEPPAASTPSSSLVTVSIDVDPTALAPHARRDFIEYLCDAPLHIEAWDADSLLPFGSALVHLGPLLRQQRESAASARQYDLVSGIVGCVGGGGGTSNPVSGAADFSGMSGGYPGLVGTPVGTLQVVMLSTGHRGAESLAPDTSHVTSGTPLGTGGALPWRGGGQQSRGVRVRARPLATGDPLLSALLRSRGAGRQHSLPAAATPQTAAGADVREDMDGLRIAAIDDVTPASSPVADAVQGTASTPALRLSPADLGLLRQLFDAVEAPGTIDCRRFAHFVQRSVSESDLPRHLHHLAFHGASRSEPGAPEIGAPARSLAQLQAALAVAWERAVEVAAVADYENDPSVPHQRRQRTQRPGVSDVYDALERSFSRASALVQKKAAKVRRSPRTPAEGGWDTEDGSGLESTFLRGEANVSNLLRDGELTVGRIRHTLATAADIQLMDGEFRTILAAVYGSADAPGRIVATGAADERVELQAVPFAPLISFISDSYEAWIGGATLGGPYAPADARLKPELTILRGKLRFAMAASSREHAANAPLDLTTLLKAADFAGSGHLEWSAFVRVLVEDLHMRIDTNTALQRDDAGLALSADDRATIARQLARSDAQQREAARQGLALKPSEQDEASANLARDEELALLRAYREGHKPDVVRQRLQDAITATVDIYPRFGQATYFEFSVHNPFAYEESFVLRIDDPTVLPSSATGPEFRIVHDPVEARSLRSVLPVACSDAGETMIQAHAAGQGPTSIRAASEALDTPQFKAHGIVLLQPGERLVLPLVFLSMQAGPVEGSGVTVSGTHASAQSLDRYPHVTQLGHAYSASASAPAANALQPRTLTLTVNSARHGQTTSMLRVIVNPRPFPVHRTIRFFNAENEYLRAVLPAPPSGGGQQTSVQMYGGLDVPLMGGASAMTAIAGPPGRYVVCPSSDVVVSSEEHAGVRELHLRVRSAGFPSTTVFHVLLYNDPFCASMYACWRVVVHSLLRVDVNSVLGQSTSLDLLIRGGSRARRVALYSSHPRELRFPTQVAGAHFSLLAGALNRLTLTAQPLAATPSGRAMFVHLVDVDSRALVAAWRVLCAQAPPAVTRTYNIQCGVGTCANKKIPYRNDWDKPRSYSIVAGSSQGSGGGIVVVKDPRLCIQAHSSGFIRISIGPVWGVGTEDVLIFVNDETGQNEETLLLHLLFK